MDIRNNRDYSKPITFKQLWLQEQYKRLRKIYDPTEISNEDLKNILLSEFEKRRIVQGRFYSNTTQKNEVMTQEQFINLFLNHPYILSGYATLYLDHDNSKNIGAAAIKFLLDSRKVYKKKMEESEYGSDQYIYYKILQSTFKVLANSYYGILGERNSVFYNPHVQNSITMTGQDLITTAIISLENFLGDNVKFNDADDIISYINFVTSEKIEDQIMKYIDEPVGMEDVFNYFMKKTESTISDRMKSKIKKLLSGLSIEDLNRLFYKNKIMSLLKNSTYLRKKLNDILKYEYKEQPAEEIKEELKSFKTIIINFCFENAIYEDRFKHVIKDDRKNVVVSDTDSAFVNLNNYLEDTTDLLNLDSKNSTQQMSLMNVFISIITEALEDTFWKLTGNMGLTDDFKPIISMKNEFLFKKLLLTRNKKSYAGLIVAELGKLLSRPIPDMKGLSIKKSSVAKTLRKKFNDILVQDVLNSEEVDLKKIINKFDELGIQIEESLKRGEILYSLPKNVEQIEGYKDPSMQEPVRGVLVWNALEPEFQINPPEKINIIKLRAFDKDCKEFQDLKVSHPDKYNAIMDVVFNQSGTNKIDISRFGLSVVAIPKSVEKIPSYLLPMIDYQSIVNNNMTNGYIILESLGIFTEEVKTTKYKSNIIEI
jgi:hypothetical protein